jgi:hemolysin D
MAQKQPVEKVNEQDADDAKANGPGYIAHVALDSTQMMIDGQEPAVAPGMAVMAEIKTARRSVISYLLSPLQRYAHEGIRER